VRKPCRHLVHEQVSFQTHSLNKILIRFFYWNVKKCSFFNCEQNVPQERIVRQPGLPKSSIFTSAKDSWRKQCRFHHRPFSQFQEVNLLLHWKCLIEATVHRGYVSSFFQVPRYGFKRFFFGVPHLATYIFFLFSIN
jgi:hypothetical protein